METLLTIYLATSKDFLAQPHTDDVIIQQALQAKGYITKLVAWNDPSVEWSSADLVIIRSTWDYCEHYEAFMEWTTKVSSQTNLWNPVELIQWNSDKNYLFQLAQTGLPTIPTALLDYRHLNLENFFERWQTNKIVIKPVIGANSFSTFFVELPIKATMVKAIKKAARLRTLFVQPYLPTVEEYGERSLVFIDGMFAHAFRKTPFYAFSHENSGHEKETSVYPSKQELALAETIIKRLKHQLLFGRIDLLNDANGETRIMELEFIEPRLNLHYSDISTERLVQAIERKLHALPIKLKPARI